MDMSAHCDKRLSSAGARGGHGHSSVLLLLGRLGLGRLSLHLDDALADEVPGVQHLQAYQSPLKLGMH